MNLKSFFKSCGGVSKVAALLGVHERSLYYWCERNSLPRTEYTGETNYSQVLAELSGQSVDNIKNNFKPTKQKPTSRG